MCSSIGMFMHNNIHADTNNSNNPYSSKIANAYDISQWQGHINQNQANNLKNEVNFMILKGENGTYPDPQVANNKNILTRAGVPYGVYDYSVYTNPAQASLEAKDLYQNSPQAKFYVNDSEVNNAGSLLNASTQSWANEIHSLTRKPAVLYSDNAFLTSNMAPRTLNDYDTIWDAAYGSQPNPDFHYDLWQDTDSQYSPALNQRVDADVFPVGYNKPLSFWTGKGTSNVNTPNSSSSVSEANPIEENSASTTYVAPIKRHHHHHHKLVSTTNGSIQQPTVIEQENKTRLNNDINLIKSADKYIHSMDNNLKHQSDVSFHTLDAAYDELGQYKSDYIFDENLLHKSGFHNKALRHQLNRLRHEMKHSHHVLDNISYIQRNSMLNNYYHNKHIHKLYVKSNYVTIYNASSHRRVGRLHHGARIKHIHFYFINWHHKIIVRAVGTYHGAPITFTDNKKFVSAHKLI